MEVCPGTGNPAAGPPHLSPKPPTADSPQATPVSHTLPSPELKVVAMNKKPVLWHLREKIEALSPVDSVPRSFSLLGAMWAADPGAGTLGLGAQSGVRASLISGRSSHSHAVTGACNGGSSAGPFHVPALPIHLKVVSACPWFRVSFSGSLWSYISGGCCHLYFYCQFGSERRCETDPPTLPPSCPLL